MLGRVASAEFDFSVAKDETHFIRLSLDKVHSQNAFETHLVQTKHCQSAPLIPVVQNGLEVHQSPDSLFENDPLTPEGYRVLKEALTDELRRESLEEFLSGDETFVKNLVEIIRPKRRSPELSSTNNNVPPPPSGQPSAPNAVTQLRLNLFSLGASAPNVLPLKLSEINLVKEEPETVFGENAANAAELLIRLMVKTNGLELNRHLCAIAMEDLFRYFHLSSASEMTTLQERLSLDDHGSSNLNLFLKIFGPQLPSRTQCKLDDHGASNFRLGAGMHGAVYATEDPRVAEKKIPLNCSDVGSRASRVFAEVVALSRLTSKVESCRPYVTKLLNVRCNPSCSNFQSSEISLFLERAEMNLLEWRQNLTKEVELSVHLVQSCLNMAIAVAESLEFVHTRGVVHYDLRCENVLIVANNNVGTGQLSYMPVLGDFGEAHNSEWQSAFQFSSRGAECIKSPEMLRVCTAKQAQQREDHDRRRLFEFGTSAASDVWSLGCLIFEVLTGEYLFQEAVESWATFFTRITTASSSDSLPIIPESRRAVLQNVVGAERSDRICALLERLLVVDPRKRPTASQALALLQYFSENEI